MILTDETLAKDLIQRMEDRYKESLEGKEIQNLKAKISGVNSQLDAMAERLSELPKSVSAAPIFKQMEKLTEHKNLFEKQLKTLKNNTHLHEKPIEFKHYKTLLESLSEFWKKGDPETRSKIIHWLIHRIDVGKDSVTINYQLIENRLVQESVLADSAPLGAIKMNLKNFMSKRVRIV